MSEERPLELLPDEILQKQFDDTLAHLRFLVNSNVDIWKTATCCDISQAATRLDQMWAEQFTRKACKMAEVLAGQPLEEQSVLGWDRNRPVPRWWDDD